ncbi:hypothetical protein IFM51744_08194 [Aspergillus udagawae]|uniref:Uncharacterized protein n=1 Tax=Aspergillus udagawae TaxID=91492 RepID=A0ABQ1BBN8_9EURO|nr:hypothetical protein IFM51744_08194 [Aspergillus udagawae]GFF97866.1 hypothetical protein IFM53868_09498 [Aspergillus udagawae]GFG16968.1 hypothetical protein IFM5058_08231 [Aspergillus udagawae]
MHSTSTCDQAEEASLLGHADQRNRNCVVSDESKAVPVSFLASSALHMTAASSVWAVASLFCEDADHCQGEETRRYAASVATATALANAAGLLTLGYMKRVVHWDVRVGLVIWLLCRAVGALGVVVGVGLRSYPCVLGALILQGLASDNLLHFTLNVIYVQATSPETISMLMGSSLACYMVGMALAPLSAGWLPSVEWTFFVAIGLFIIAIVYVLLVVSGTVREPQVHSATASLSSETTTIRKACTSRLAEILSPAGFFYEYPGTILFGLSLLLYNMVQGYMINLVFIFTSLQFGFSPANNGALLSLIAVTAAGYLIFSSFIVPKVLSLAGRTPTRQDTQPRLFDLGAAVLSILSQVAAALFLSQSQQVYLAASLLAVGLATPSFVKSFVVVQFEAKSRVVAALALMETAGGLLSPVVLGPWQANHPDGSAFYVAAVILGVSVCCLVAGGCVRHS